MKQVDELVEYVAEKISVLTTGEKWEHKGAEWITHRIAKQILSHPDLALIDRGEEEIECSLCGGTGESIHGIFTCKNCKGSGLERSLVENVIPLAEEVKNALNGY
ncbi:hypothetical protein LCGC14_0917310 [marine sediment metagenome]|uniref:Uncharacterized protein n=1 Tax=marine sediment metagenome TaxID=412755 RepID=A0A0F9NRW5_9ZZZZ